jgi:hypothetical protein
VFPVRYELDSYILLRVIQSAKFYWVRKIEGIELTVTHH